MNDQFGFEPTPEVKPIPKCAYLVKKGEQPRQDRKNIFAYRESLAMQPHKFEPLKGPLPELPVKKFVKDMAGAPKVNPVAAVVNISEPSAEDLKQVVIFAAFDNLEQKDISLKGLPIVERVRELSGMEDLSAEEIRAAWAEYKEANKAGRE